jgi:uncharacterized protein YdaU (DUF1376 family)
MSIGHNGASGENLQISHEDETGAKLFRYMPLHIGDWQLGTNGLTFEMKGFYIDFLTRLYDRGKPFPDDDRAMSELLKLSIRVWKRLKEALVTLGKILVRNGGLTNARFEKERQKRAEEIRKRADAAKARWQDSREKAEKFPDSFPEVSPKLSGKDGLYINKNNDLEIKMDGLLTVIDNEEKDKSPNGDSPSDQLELVPNGTPKMTASLAAKEAFQLYNAVAQRCDLPVARSLSHSRKRSLALRVKEAGGLDGFRTALAHLERSAFLQGQNDRGWKADIDWLCQPSSFMRLLEGGYGNGAHAIRQAQAKKLNLSVYDGVL